MALIKLNNRSAPASTFGSVLQVKHAESSVISSHTGGDGTFTDSNLTVSITPASSTSKLLIHVSFIYGSTDSTALHCRLKKVTGGTTSQLHFEANDGSNRSVLGNVRASQNQAQGFQNFSTIIEDTPATTSQITYTIQGEAAAGTLYINGRNDANIICDRLGHITITEIAG